MRVLLFILISGFCIVQRSNAQQDQIENDPDQLEVVVLQEESTETANEVKTNRLKTHLEVGTSFTCSPNNFYGPSYYIAPSLFYLVTPRFLLSTGVAIEHSNYYIMQLQDLNSDGMLPMTRAFLFAKGTYMLTQKLAVSGTVYKSINNVQNPGGRSYPYNCNYQGISMGLDYKINDSFSVGFHMGTQGGYYNSNALIPSSGYVYVPGF